MPVILEPGRQKQEDQEFKVRQALKGSQGRPRLAEKTVSITVSKQKHN